MAHPSDLSTIGKPFIELQSVDSTNNYARSLIDQQMAGHGTAIFAHEQLLGKGQRGKKWVSQKDANLVLSIIIDPKIDKITEPFQLIVITSLAVQQLFSGRAGQPVSIKWPNDLYWDDKKAGGILIENIIATGSDNIPDWKWAIVGVGLNINQTDFPPELPNPVSLKNLTGGDSDPLQLAKDLCDLLSGYLNSLKTKGFKVLFEEYNKKLYKKDQGIKLKKGSRIFEAELIGVSTSGKLIVNHGIEDEFSYEEIEWII